MNQFHLSPGVFDCVCPVISVTQWTPTMSQQHNWRAITQELGGGFPPLSPGSFYISVCSHVCRWSAPTATNANEQEKGEGF